MPDLYEQVTAEVDRNERVHGNGADPTHRALRTLLGEHGKTWTNQRGTFCAACGDGFPCEELRTIAVVMGLEVPNG